MGRPALLRVEDEQIGDSWLITGAAGRLGRQMCRHLVRGDCRVVALTYRHPTGIVGVSESRADVTLPGEVDRAIGESGCRYIVHAAGLADVDACEARPDEASRLHVEATRNVAAAARRADATLIYVSTDHLWQGKHPFVDEQTPPNPMNVYACTKLEGEIITLGANADNLIIRTNFFGPGPPWRPSFSDRIREALRRGDRLSMFSDVFFTPISTQLLCPLVMDLVRKRASGTFHVASAERLSKFEFALRLARAFGFDRSSIQAASLADARLLAARPNDMSLATDKAARFLGRPMPTCDESLESLKEAAVESHVVRG